MASDFISVTSKFLGLHECEKGEGVLERGESPRMKNLAVTPEYSLICRDGWEVISATEGEGRGLYVGEVTAWVVSERVYLRDGGGERMIGELESGSGNVTVFYHRSRLYFLDGVRIKVWDGEVFGDLEPYLPTVAVNCDSLGAGTPFEEVNILTPRRRVTFSADGTSASYALPEKNAAQIEGVTYNGGYVSLKNLTFDSASGVIAFDFVPREGIGNIEVIYRSSADCSGDIHRMRYASLYGGENDTGVFLWGDADYPSHIRYSGAFGGISGLEYFPELSFISLPTGERVTSLIRHYGSALVFAPHSVWRLDPETRTDGHGRERTVYPMTAVSCQTGNDADNFVCLIDNTPVSLTASGLWRWRSSSIRDERNAEEIGGRIRRGLRSLGCDGTRSFDRQSAFELFIWKGERVYVYNYALDVFYYFEGFGAAAFGEDGFGRCYFVRSDGALCAFTEDTLDSDEPIDFVWESGYGEYSGLDTKNVHRLELELYPGISSEFGLVWVSERQTGRCDNLTLNFRVCDFGELLFDDLSFATSRSSVRLVKRIKAKRVGSFKVIISKKGGRGDFHLISLAAIGRKTDL